MEGLLSTGPTPSTFIVQVPPVVTATVVESEEENNVMDVIHGRDMEHIPTLALGTWRSRVVCREASRESRSIQHSPTISGLGFSS